jgi:PAS domain S-box-containing protein
VYGEGVALQASDPGTLLTGERRVLELIATGAPLADTLDALCRAIDDQSDLMSAVFLLDRDGDQIVLAAGPHLPIAWREATSRFPNAPTNGACGAAIHRREQVIVADVASSPLFATWRDPARLAGIASLWSTPFFSKDGRPLGTFAVVSREPGHPTRTDLDLVARATHLASIAVERHLTEEGLRESEIRFSTAFYASPACMTIMRFADGRFLYVNDAFVAMFGYSRGETIGRTAIDLGLYADPALRTTMMQSLAEGRTRDLEARARTKSGQILNLMVSMERVELHGEASVLQIATDITHRKQTEEALRRNEQLLRLVLEAIPVGVAVLDPDGHIVLTNPASARIWGKAAIQNGPERYATSAGWWHDSGRRIEPDDWTSARTLRTGESFINEVIDIDTFDGFRKIIQNSAVAVRDEHQGIVGAVVVNEDISAREAAEEGLERSVSVLRALTGKLLRAQDDERRRIAQLLHETTAQDLAAMKMLLGRLRRTCLTMTDADRAVLAESVDLAERSMAGIRTLSYLLHPPFLDENGLLFAVRWYVKGFVDRSGIAVDLDLPDTFERLPQQVETALFRVVQEALINVHRHANSSTARIRLRIVGGNLTLEIEDHGRGMPEALLAKGPEGVGIAGMRERLEELGGRIEIESGVGGTTIRAVVPLPAQP